ncbi:MAG TPA: hypothetical protein VGI39_03630 [Polyangiaceae bacterium]|jgi:hypothetical protein
MHMRVALASVTVTWICSLLLGGCSSSDSNSPAPPTFGFDSSVPTGDDQSGDDGGSGDDGSGDDGSGDDGGGPATLPDGAIPPQGVQLAAGDALELQGITSDGYAVYADTTANTLSAVAVAGGKPIAIGPIDPNGAAVQVMGPVVFNWTAVNQSTGSGTLSVWTAAHQLQQLSTSSQAPSGFQSVAVSADGTQVIFYDALSTDGNTANLAVAGTDGASKPTTFLSGVNIGNQSCFPVFTFAGADIAVAYIRAADGGAPDASGGGGDGGGAAQYLATVSAFTGASWTQKDLTKQPALCALAVDSKASQLLVATTAGLFAYPAASLATGTGELTLDAKGVWGKFAEGDGGLGVVYTDNASALKRISVASKATGAVLVTSGLTNVEALSPDQAWVLANDVVQVGAQGAVADLFLASATTAGSATSLVSTPISTPAGDSFTADSTHALYAATVTSDAGVTSPGLYSVATSGGAPSPVVSNVGSVFAASGAQIVFNANDDQGGYDLFRADTSKGGAPTLLVSVADQAFLLTPAKDQVVYTWSYLSGAMAGLYALPLK